MVKNVVGISFNQSIFVENGPSKAFSLSLSFLFVLVSPHFSHVSVRPGHEILVDLRLVSTELRGVTSIILTLPLEWRTALFA